MDVNTYLSNDQPVTGIIDNELVNVKRGKPKNECRYVYKKGEKRGEKCKNPV